MHTLGSVKVFWVAFRVSLGLFDCNRVFHFSPFCKVCYVNRCCTFICHTKLILCTTVINYTRKALKYYLNKCTGILNEASHIFSILYMLMKWFTCSLTYLSIIFLDKNNCINLFPRFRRGYLKVSKKMGE